jgi:hypothetical protein
VVIWAGDGSPRKHNRQPLFFAYALCAVRKASATPLVKGNKNRGSIPRPQAHGPTTPTVDNYVVKFELQNVYNH